jgi:HK97 gp10 family phage protein
MAELSPRLRARLAKIPDIAREAAVEAMEEGAQEIVDAMKMAAPIESGDLRASIGWTWGEVPAGSFMIDEIRSGKNKGDQYATLRIKIYAGNKDAFYARFIEFGTRSQPAQSFFFPTWKRDRAKFRRRIRDRIRKRIKEAFNG